MQTWTMQATQHAEAGTVFGSTFGYSPVQHGQILHVASEVAPRTSRTLLFRVVLVTSSGSFQSWLGGGLQWSREEGLAHLTSDKRSPSIAFLPLSSSVVHPQVSPMSAMSVIKSAKQSLVYALQAVGLTSGSTGLSTTVSRDWLSAAFGYRKLVIAATEYGKIYAIDLGNSGKLVWTTYVLPLQSGVTQTSAPRRLQWKKIAVFDQLASGKVLVMAVVQLETVGVRITMRWVLSYVADYGVRMP